ncbi:MULTISPECIES: SWIM zinc finger family protein [Streptomyces albogriseolus group]|uniref:SWIM zinc finger family protein n=1 Tax=Streptomyces albogriseolus group TaxID=2867120 RepID=UPI00384C582E
MVEAGWCGCCTSLLYSLPCRHVLGMSLTLQSTLIVRPALLDPDHDRERVRSAVGEDAGECLPHASCVRSRRM